MPDPVRLVKILQQAVQLFRATPGRRGRFVALDDAQEVLVAGDLHGNVENFRLLLQKAELAKHPGRHLVLQEVIHGKFYYPQGGEKSHQLLDLLAALKVQFPKQVHMLLGNHELSQWTNRLIGKGDEDLNALFRQGVNAAYADHADAVYAGYSELFSVMSLALRTANRVYLSHTLVQAKFLPAFDPAMLEREELSEADISLGGAVHAITWGRDTSQANAVAFLKKVDADLLITGHIPCEKGYDTPNDRQLILDALGTPACYVLFPTDKPLTHAELVARVGTL
jgi:Calcineurin-like phosphoesterase